MKWKKYKPLLLSLGLVLLVGGAGALVSRAGMPAYDQLLKPALTPLSWLFPVAWTILYVLMALSAVLVWRSNQRGRKAALTVYAVQLLFNLLWSVFFFGLQWHGFAFFWLAALWLLVLLMVVLFYRVSPLAGLLQLPYLLWLTFAGYLNLGVWLLNR